MQISQKDVQVLNVLGRGASSVVSSVSHDIDCQECLVTVVLQGLLLLLCHQVCCRS